MNWVFTPAKWWQFWRPQSGFVGGLLFALLMWLCVGFLVWMFLNLDPDTSIAQISPEPTVNHDSEILASCMNKKRINLGDGTVMTCRIRKVNT